ncbi:elongation factor 4, partial [TM7 phylum sp. oral taxon 350]
MNQKDIRNFCIIAHIDHGKSTLADRMMELTGAVKKRDMKSQLLDSMELEREKGITIKLAPVSMKYRGKLLNLIDTPGHVDFSYEVSRSLAACEGAVLVVDASQGIQAQTLANVYLAMDADLEIIPVLNKIDLPAADVDRVSQELINLLGCKKEEIIAISAKTGKNVEAVLDAVIDRTPCPNGKEDSVTRALIFDSYYDDYRGVILYVRAIDGSIKKNDTIHMMQTGKDAIALEVGKLTPQMSPEKEISVGEIGYIVTNLKTTRDAKVGDTVTTKRMQSEEPLSGYKNVKPFVYAGFFPVSNEDYADLKEAVEKLSLSDSALQFEPENSPVLGFGIRIGFLGLLHMDIIRERLEREYDLDLVVTNPSTDYQVILINGEKMDVKSASDLPDISKIAEIKEPWIKGEIVVPNEYAGAVIQLIISKRGRQKNLSYIDTRVLISFEAPLANLLTDFYDQLKS